MLLRILYLYRIGPAVYIHIQSIGAVHVHIYHLGYLPRRKAPGLCHYGVDNNLGLASLSCDGGRSIKDAVYALQHGFQSL